MTTTSPTTDPRWNPAAHTSALDRLVRPMVRDERDVVFPTAILQISVAVLPLAVAMFFIPPFWAMIVGFPYLAYAFKTWCAHYMLMSHAVMHRPTFARGYAWLGVWLSWVLGPLFGCTPTAYQVHHLGMHHPENNLEADLSTTLPYVRDRFPHFAQYWLRFFIPGLPHLVMYLLGHRRHKLARQLVIGEGAWLLAVVLLGVLNPVATFWTLVAPFLLLRVLMMCGNFAQHAFVDVDDPNNAFRNSTCLINTPYNHVAFNDGYHIVHHVKANLHWSEMAQWYDDNRERFAAEDAVVFDGLFDNQHVWWLLMRQRYDILADHLVDFRNRSKEEKIRFLQSRTRGTRGAFPTLFAPAITPTAPSPAA